MRPCSPSPPNRSERAFAPFPERHGHSRTVPGPGFTSHFKLYLLWGFISVVVQIQKKKPTHFVTTCFKKCVQMLLTTMASLDLQRRPLRAAPAPGQRTGLGCSWLKCSEKDAISRRGFTRCLWNVHLYLDVSCAVFLLALRCNSKNRSRMPFHGEWL